MWSPLASFRRTPVVVVSSSKATARRKEAEKKEVNRRRKQYPPSPRSLHSCIFKARHLSSFTLHTRVCHEGADEGYAICWREPTTIAAPRPLHVIAGSGHVIRPDRRRRRRQRWAARAVPGLLRHDPPRRARARRARAAVRRRRRRPQRARQDRVGLPQLCGVQQLARGGAGAPGIASRPKPDRRQRLYTTPLGGEARVGGDGGHADGVRRRSVFAQPLRQDARPAGLASHPTPHRPLACPSQERR